ncbi:dienelactone hydrolase family protein [Pseudooctadecabacter jejudonensis]|nr:dienelactone hydrolase family protein [Pseudooctadecabacter jejudonensis]
MGVSLSRPVYVSKTGTKPLIILHELPGMSPSFLDFCCRMAGEGFKVYMPLLYMTPGTEMGAARMLGFCLSREFRALFAADPATKARPISMWLRELAVEVAAQNGGAKTGVIGMCMTGGFAIAAIAEPSVKAVVSCQPSAPFFTGIETLGLSDRERADVRNGLSGKAMPCVKAYRYQRDHLCRSTHLEAAAEILGSYFERHPDLPGKGHATLTTNSASDAVYRDALAFLRERL